MDASELASEKAPPSSGSRTANGAGWSEGDDGTNLREAINILRRRRTVILGCIATITVISAAIIFQLTPRYTAESDVMLDLRKTQVVDVQAVVSGLPADYAVVRSEMDVIKSSSLAETVSRQANLIAVPEFNARLRPPSFMSTVMTPLHWTLAGIKSLFISAPKPPPLVDPAKAELASVASALQGHVDVENDGRSYVIKVRVTSEDPRLAATLAKDYADAYLNSQLEAKFAAVQRANTWLNQHLTDLRAQVQASDRALQVFASQHNLTLNKGQTVTAEQISGINTQLVLASADLAQKEANLRQAQGLIKTGGISAAAQVLSSPLIQNLREQQAKLLLEQAQLSTRYKPEHPAMINIRAQLRDLNQKIQDEIDRIVSGIQAEVVAAQAKVGSLRQSLADLQQSGVQSDVQVQFEELQREAQANRTLYETFLNRFKQTSTEADVQQPDARIISEPIAPGAPSFPKKGPLLAFAFFGSIFIGVFAAFGIERLDNGFRTGEQIEKTLDVPVLGLEPDTLGGEPPHDIAVRRPVSSYSEAIRSIRTALRYSDVDAPPKVVLVTSALPGEGKSVFALSLARGAAKSGSKVLVIDCDLRRPSLSKEFNIEPAPGLLAFFDDAADKSNIIKVDDESGCHIIPVTPGTSNPQDLLGSRHMKALIDVMRARYDLIVIDTPPVLAVSDALVLSHFADATVFLIRWAKTPRTVAAGAVKSFLTLGGKLAGIVLSRVDMRRHVMYGYGDPGYYYGENRKYDAYATYGETTEHRRPAGKSAA